MCTKHFTAQQDWVVFQNNQQFIIHVSAWSWAVFDGPQFTDNMYVLEEGEYPNPEALGLLHSDCKISSVHTVGHVSTEKMMGSEETDLWARQNI